MQPCKTEDQLYSDASPNSECSLVVLVSIYKWGRMLVLGWEWPDRNFDLENALKLILMVKKPRPFVYIICLLHTLSAPYWSLLN